MLTALLAGCGGQQTRVISTPRQAHRPAHPPQPVRAPPRPEAQVLRLPGLEGVIGSDARALTAEFGSPQLDVREGDARKLQFSGEPCVLDVYLYPPDKGGGEPRATYVDARRASDGQDVDRAACVAALKRR
jgi:hypothetical protein